MFNTPASKTSGSASASALATRKTAPFPDLFGQMLETQAEELCSSSLGAVLESKPTTAAAAGASKKAAVEKNPNASGAPAQDTGQAPVAADTASAQPRYPWLPLSGQLTFLAASAGPFSANGDIGDIGGAGAASRDSTPPVGAHAEVAAVGVAVSQPAATPGDAANPGQAFVGNSLPWASSEPPSQQEPEPSGPLAVTTAMAGNTGAVRRAAPDAASNVHASAPGLPATAAPPDDPAPQTKRTTAKTTRNKAEPAAAVQAASSVGAEAIGTATILPARLATRTGGQSPEPDEVAPEQADAAAAGGDSQLGGDGFVTQGTLAFQALLVPQPSYNPQLTVQAPEAAGAASVAANPSPGAGAGSSGGRSGSAAPRDPDLGPAVAIQTGQASGTAQAPVPAASNADAAAAQNTGRGHAASPTSANPSAASAAEAAAAPKPAAGGATREIRLELRDADARVDVRLVERAGVVQVDVRTPDGHLAESLRSDLPALTARLEQTGLRAETWHNAPADSATRIKVAEPASSAGFQSSQNQSRREGGGRDPRDGQPQEKRQNQPQPEPKEFSWLYTSLT